MHFCQIDNFNPINFKGLYFEMYFLIVLILCLVLMLNYSEKEKIIWILNFYD